MTKYAQIELSDPLYEWENLRFVTFQSPALGRRGDVTLFIPPGAAGARDLPLVLLLHGAFGSHWAWALKGGAHRTAARLIAAGDIPPLVLAMPSDGLWAEGSGYLAHAAADYERWIVDDVVGCVREVVPEVGQGSGLFIAGLSLGGYGALRLGAKYARRFQGIAAHSAATQLARLQALVAPRRIELAGEEAGEASIPFWLARNRAYLPPIRFDCGVEDDLIADNRALHGRMLEMGIAHQYAEFPGGHTWPYWQAHIEDTLRFFGGQLA